MTLPQPQSTDQPILRLGSKFYDPVQPASFPQCTERFWNDRAAAEVGLSAIDRAEHFCRFRPLAAGLPQALALRYHGHQFRHYNPDLGDGRGFLFAQVRDGDGRLLDLGTKGTGKTPWSRFGDGRLTLKGGVREVLATEMLEALGVDTSRTFALFETGEQLERNDEPSPTRSAVLTRLSHGHIRIGTFQRLAYLDDRDGLHALVSYSLHFLFAEDPDAGALRLLDLACEATARLAASYLAAGFVHGVLNTDNINLTGESFDYGPWRFAPTWDPDFVAAYFDHAGLYAFGRQPEAIQWNLAQLAGCLSLITEDHRALRDILGRFADRFHVSLTARLLWRLGLPPVDPDADRDLARMLIQALGASQVQLDRFFHDWRGGKCRAPESYDHAAFADLTAALAGRARDTSKPYWTQRSPCSLQIKEVEAIWDAISTRDDWQPFNDKVTEIRQFGEALQEA